MLMDLSATTHFYVRCREIHLQQFIYVVTIANPQQVHIHLNIRLKVSGDYWVQCFMNVALEGFDVQIDRTVVVISASLTSVKSKYTRFLSHEIVLS